MYKKAALFLAAALLAGCQSQQQIGQIKPEMKAQYDMAFQEMLSKPGDIPVALKYAAVAKEAGDVEGAIGTYEGLLVMSADLPQVRVELATLYMQLKSYDAARVQLEQALQSPNLPPALRKPSEQLLAKMPKQRSRS
jgi:tetratricopeptide (TPR) repeat protein